MLTFDPESQRLSDDSRSSLPAGGYGHSFLAANPSTRSAHLRRPPGSRDRQPSAAGQSVFSAPGEDTLSLLVKSQGHVRAKRVSWKP